MAINELAYKKLSKDLAEEKVTLIAVSKTKTIEDIQTLYNLGQRDFGENYVQELTEKQSVLPKDIRWHFIGHLQTNKVKYIAPFVYLVHSVDSFKLLQEINKQALKNNRIINCLLQVHIAREETKFGMDEHELDLVITHYRDAKMEHAKITGLMGMASFTENVEKIRTEFKQLKQLFDNYNQLSTPNHQLQILSMGMSSDYKIAIEQGSNMLRIGSLLFGARD